MAGNRVFRLRVLGDPELDKDLAALTDFYKENRDPGNSERDTLTLLRRAKQRRIFVIENPQGEIRGASLTIPYGGGNVEAGATRIIENGFGLQCIINWCSSLQEFLFSPPEGEYYSVVAATNLPSIHNLKKCLFEEWTPHRTFFAQSGYEADEVDKNAYKFFRLDPWHLQAHAASLTALHEKPFLINKTTGERIFLTFDFPMMKNEALRTLVSRVAAGTITLPI